MSKQKRYIFKFTESDPVIDAWLSCQAKNNESFRALIHDIAKQYGACDYLKKDLYIKPGRPKEHDIFDELSQPVPVPPPVPVPAPKPAPRQPVSEQVSTQTEIPVRKPSEQVIPMKPKQPEAEPAEQISVQRPADKPRSKAPSAFETQASQAAMPARENKPTDSSDDAGGLDDIMGLFDE